MAARIVDKVYPTLYKMDSTGSIRVYATQLSVKPEVQTLTIRTGSLYGAKTEHIVKYHLRASTDTELFNKADKKVQSRIDSKLKSGYSEEVPSITSALDGVMRYGSFDKYATRVKFPVIVQPKLDGVFTHFNPHDIGATLMSREGNPYTNLEFIAKEIRTHLNKVHRDYSKVPLHVEGEVYAHGFHISDLIEGIKGGRKDVLDALRLYVFDFPCSEKPYRDMTYKERLSHGYKWASFNSGKGTKLWAPMQTKIVKDTKELDSFYELCIASGYEGIMIKNMDTTYEFAKRSSNNLKRKPVITEEFMVSKVLVENNSGRELIMFECLTRNGDTFKVRPAWTIEKREKGLQEHRDSHVIFIGKQATVEFRSWTKYNKPFHPVLIAIRDYE